MQPLIEPTLPIGAASIALVQHSFARVAPAGARAAQQFYGHLFQAHPELRVLFKADMRVQGNKLMDMLAVAVAMLNRPWALGSVLRQLGVRHAGYGVQDWHYDAVGAALIKAMADALGPAFGTPERDAWAHVYGCLATAMKAASSEASPATSSTPVADAATTFNQENPA